MSTVPGRGPMASVPGSSEDKHIMRNWILVAIILVTICGTAAAQDTFEERELITVLNFGADVFEPELWLASGSESITNTTVSWQSTYESGFSGLSFANYLHFDTGYTLDGLDAFFNDDWFNQTFISWEDLQKTNVCFDGDLTLHEFTLAFRDSENNLTYYGLRYWVEPVSETRVLAWHIAFAITYSDGTPNPDGQAQLDDYGERMYPNLPGCGL
jgi:hypothetical protein